MICPNCLHKIEDDSLFCSVCGSGLRTGVRQIPLNNTNTNIRNKSSLFVIYIITAFAGCILFFISAEQISKVGDDMTTLQSQAGISLAEVYYQDVGKALKGFAMFVRGLGVSVLAIIVAIVLSGTKINNNKATLVENKDGSTLVEKITQIKIPDLKKLSVKKVIIDLISLILICSSWFGGYKYVQAKEFNNLVKIASQKLNAGNCDEAIQLYSKALTYRNDSNVQKELTLAQKYKQYQNIYNEGLKLINDKKYSDAIQKLNTINQDALQIYNNAQNKILQCKKNIINDNIQATNNAIKNGDYDSANKYIENILEVDANNNDTTQLKNTITQAQEKSKEEEEAKEQQQAINNSIVIKYSIDEYGYIMNTNYPDGSSIQVKKGQLINLVGDVSPKSSQRVLFDANVMESVSPIAMKAISVGGGDINIIPNEYDWDKAYKYHIIISN
ncbi:hypothetical protein [Clostridium sp. BJN0013]|uniref:hypothetical protein n=1 Tax=Clostridium sp. BJN0013 TaxID=3236840 RepID=UPI0034C69194